MQATPAKQWTVRQAIAPGLEGVRRHWPPLVAIQLCAVALVVSYYHVSALQASAASVAEAKLRFGLPFAFGIGFLAGGIVPEIAKLVTGTLKKVNRAWIGDTLFNGFVYGVVGVMVDLFYQRQATMFGYVPNVHTVFIKTTIDMGVFSPVASIPVATILLAWRRNHYRLQPVFKGGFRDFYMNQVMVGLIPCWAFWIPVLLCSYAMPVNLQLVFSTLAEAAWSIVFVFISNQPIVAP